MNSLLKVIPFYNNEQRLIKLAAKNDRDAQRLIYDQYSAKMLSVCRYYIKDLQEAEDTMLNGFYKVFKNLGSYRSEGSFEGWIRRIMVREALSYHRKNKKLETPTDQLENQDNGSVEMEVNLDLDIIQNLIDELPEGYRIVFLMYAIEGYSHQEIADELNISAGTSKSQLFKARRMLQEKIKRINTIRYGTNEV